VRSVCPYCGVGCQVDLHVADNKVIRVTSPDIELNTPIRIHLREGGVSV